MTVKLKQKNEEKICFKVEIYEGTLGNIFSFGNQVNYVVKMKNNILKLPCWHLSSHG